MRTCLVCAEPAIPEEVWKSNAVCRECELRRQSRETELPTDLSDEERAERFIRGSGWRLATTMLNIPHQYTIRDLETPEARKTTALSHSEFEWFTQFIRDNGEVKPWGRYRNTYLTVSEWEYWSMGFPIDETTVINRQAAGPAAKDFMRQEVEAARLTQ